MKWPSWIRNPLRATPGVAVTGIDQAAVIRRTAQSIWDRAVEGAKKREEADRLWKYEQTESYVCLARRVSEDKESAASEFEVSTVTEVPGCGQMARASGRTIEAAVADLRFALAQLYVGHGVVRDFDEARLRASRVELIVERSFAHGAAGIA